MAVATGGRDAPGLNAVIRGAVLTTAIPIGIALARPNRMLLASDSITSAPAARPRINLGDCDGRSADSGQG